MAKAVFVALLAVALAAATDPTPPTPNVGDVTAEVISAGPERPIPPPPQGEPPMMMVRGAPPPPPSEVDLNEDDEAPNRVHAELSEDSDDDKDEPFHGDMPPEFAMHMGMPMHVGAFPPMFLGNMHAPHHPHPAGLPLPLLNMLNSLAPKPQIRVEEIPLDALLGRGPQMMSNPEPMMLGNPEPMMIGEPMLMHGGGGPPPAAIMSLLGALHHPRPPMHLVPRAPFHHPGFLPAHPMHMMHMNPHMMHMNPHMNPHMMHMPSPHGMPVGLAQMMQLMAPPVHHAPRPDTMFDQMIGHVLEEIPDAIQAIMQEKHRTIPTDHEPMIMKLEPKGDFYVITGWFPGVTKADVKLKLDGSHFLVNGNVSDKSPSARRELGELEEIDEVDETMELPYAPDPRFFKAHFEDATHTLTAVFPKEKETDIELS